MHRRDGTVDNLATTGGYVGLWGADDWNDPDDPNAGEPGRNLDANIGIAPAVTPTLGSGTTTWFSYVAMRGWDRNEETPTRTFDLASAGLAGAERVFFGSRDSDVATVSPPP